MMRVWPQPMARAASTYVCCMAPSVAPRITRELVAAISTASEMTTLPSPGPSTAMTDRMMIRYGKRQPGVDHALHHADPRRPPK